MWGVVASIVGASVALAVLEQSLRSFNRGGPDKPQKPGALPEPDKDFASKTKPGEACTWPWGGPLPWFGVVA